MNTDNYITRQKYQKPTMTIETIELEHIIATSGNKLNISEEPLSNEARSNSYRTEWNDWSAEPY